MVDVATESGTNSGNSTKRHGNVVVSRSHTSGRSEHMACVHTTDRNIAKISRLNSCRRLATAPPKSNSSTHCHGNTQIFTLCGSDAWNMGVAHSISMHTGSSKTSCYRSAAEIKRLPPMQTAAPRPSRTHYTTLRKCMRVTGHGVITTSYKYAGMR